MSDEFFLIQKVLLLYFYLEKYFAIVILWFGRKGEIWLGCLDDSGDSDSV